MQNKFIEITTVFTLIFSFMAAGEILANKKQMPFIINAEVKNCLNWSLTPPP